MTLVNDSGRKDPSDHRGLSPSTKILRGPEDLKVTLVDWGPKKGLLARLWNQLNGTWGDVPSSYTEDEHLHPDEMESVIRAFRTRSPSVGQMMETIQFIFRIEGVSRACTHQIVRTRIGACFSQHGGRDNDWRLRSFRMPETVGRLIDYVDRDSPPHPRPRWSDGNMSYERLERFMGREASLQDMFDSVIHMGKQLYAALVDAGIPWQDARRVLPIGTTTYIYANYTYPAMKGMLANRLEHVMDWEINCVSQLMLRQLHIHCPNYMVEPLGSHSDIASEARFHKMKIMPHDGKWGVTPPDEPRKDTWYGRTQNPFWVLHPDSMRGGPVEWVATDGMYPEDL